MENAILSYVEDQLKIIITDPIVLSPEVSAQEKKTTVFVPGTPSAEIQAMINSARSLLFKVSHVGGMSVDVSIANVMSATLTLEYFDPINAQWFALSSRSDDYVDNVSLSATLPANTGGLIVRLRAEDYNGGPADVKVAGITFTPAA